MARRRRVRCIIRRARFPIGGATCYPEQPGNKMERNDNLLVHVGLCSEKKIASEDNATAHNKNQQGDRQWDDLPSMIEKQLCERRVADAQSGDAQESSSGP